ncbi:MAG: hypothetical protein O4753_13055 [Trichodesmium sp. St7_bin2_1]|nr:hypothetical protein [Trichodesmium sp. St7_bin2_1]
MDKVGIGNNRNIKASDTQGSASDEPSGLMIVQLNNNLQSSSPLNYQGGDTS